MWIPHCGSCPKLTPGFCLQVFDPMFSDVCMKIHSIQSTLLGNHVATFSSKGARHQSFFFRLWRVSDRKEDCWLVVEGVPLGGAIFF